ncbi:MAG TPA: hypothetical protein VN578_08680 [Candidatus Binatia bacterium]|jgi:hypothetical protein|nr:hypothetical protein [Candidatus Binatia bacterium]
MNIESLLKTRLAELATKRRRLQLWSGLAAGWAGVALLGLLLVFVQRATGWASSLAFPLIASLGLVAAAFVLIRQRRQRPDWNELAAQIEARYPALDGRLLTAVQQHPQPDGQLSFLQDRLVRETLEHRRQSDWADVIPQSRLRVAQAAHWLAVVLLCVALSGLRVTGGHKLLARIVESEVTVTPGDVSLERGSSLVVLARFTGALPANVELLVSPNVAQVSRLRVNQGVSPASPAVSLAAEDIRRIPLIKSLSDPMFGGSVPEVASNLVYHVEFAGQRTRDFNVTVFEHPRLERADADLTFPDYTEQPQKHIPDTRRLSAVEGSRLDFTLHFNKPVASAQLVARDKERNTVPLIIETNRPLALLKQFTLTASKTYELQLVDAEGRTNKVPAQFVFEVLKNRPPELRIAAPRGDLRPSPLEEISFEGTVWDDFGVPAYGLAYALAGGEPRFVELGHNVPAREKRAFQTVLRLEDLDAQPDQLISWFVWADDLDPDGKLRRTTSDLFFVEVRPFEEVFREGQGMDGQGEGENSGQQGGRSGRLVELQKQIVLGTWKLRRENTAAPGPNHKIPPLPSSRDTNSQTAFPGTSNRNPNRNSLPMLGSLHVLAALPSGMRQPPAPAWRDVYSEPPLGEQAQALAGRDVAIRIKHRVMAQLAAQPGGDQPASPRTRTRGNSISSPSPTASLPGDISVLREAQAEALTQARAALEGRRDPRTADLWSGAVKNMEQALARLEAATTNSPEALTEALTAEQAAYQALLRVQEHEYQVSRSRNRNQRGGGSRDQQMQRQVEEMDLTQPENRYETQRLAQSPQTAQRREQLQVMNRLQELARRQQDLNDRLKELQTALQEARTDEERAEIQRRLKRLQEEEQQMLADADEVRQRMEQPENQSRMAEQRRQLEQTRQDVQRAAEAAGQGAVSQALAAGTRAQRQLQDLRDQLRKENSSQFADDLREMRAQARELARQQEDLLQKMNTEAGSERKSLSDSPRRPQMLEQLAQQKQHLTNLVERATEVSQQAEQAEPLLSSQLYDTVRKFTQDTAKDVKELQDQMLNHGPMTRTLLDKFKDTSEQDGAKLLELTSEMLRQDFLPQANETGQRSRSGLEQLKRGVERAAESVLGDDTEALRLAQQELDQLTSQLQLEMSQAEGTNSSSSSFSSSSSGDTNQLSAAARANQPGQSGQRSSQTAQNSSQTQQGSQTGEPGANQEGTQAQSPGEQPSSPRGGQQAGNSAQPNGAQASDQTDATAQDGQNGEPQPGQPNRLGRLARNAGPRDRANDGGSFNNAGGGAGGLWVDNFRENINRLLSDGSLRPVGPLTGEDFVLWSDRLREVEEMIEQPDLRNDVAAARERARVLRQAFKNDRKKPDWAVVRLQVMKPLAEVRDRIADELARRGSREALVPIDRDPVPNRYSDLVRRYYEELGKDK